MFSGSQQVGDDEPHSGDEVIELTACRGARFTVQIVTGAMDLAELRGSDVELRINTDSDASFVHKLGGAEHGRFGQGQMDSFEVTMPRFDKIESIRIVLIPHVGRPMCRWFVDTVVLREHSAPQNKLWHIDVHHWLTNWKPHTAQGRLKLPFDDAHLHLQADARRRAVAGNVLEDSSRHIGLDPLDTLSVVRAVPPPCTPTDYSVSVHTIASSGWVSRSPVHRRTAYYASLSSFGPRYFSCFSVALLSGI